MKRYHIIGLALLAGFIAGCSIPAHAETVSRSTNTIVLDSGEQVEAILSQCMNSTNHSVVMYDYTSDGVEHISFDGMRFAFTVTKDGLSYFESTESPHLMLVTDETLDNARLLDNGSVSETYRCE